MTACSQDEKRSTVKDLLTAAADNDTAAIKSLLQANAKLEQRDNKKRTPLMVAVYHHHPEAAALLIAAGADVNAQDDMQNSPFLYAGAEGYVDILQLCLQAGARFDVFNRYGGSALIPACERGHVEVVKTLLAVKDFPIDHVNRLGWTGLLEAIILSNGGPKHIQIVQLLVDAGANVNLADGDGVSPLAHARSKGFTEIVSILEKAGAK
ncbi:ankyrin repeat domain-containing protein [Chitinophaga sp. sic0106]|uniref:ankyrin repeat domain-containing protein n=1 Tax=Chitinophaga sp. sic0106 TaxID=2854785 RepID=UPI001C48B135|nr:ankyrin repeat domain-containing protein [Chitinophaga sp. sic0106]MBV7530353.1 ankyrin repeat domain-containing protein [Chitinophaga sp. sic0106]